MKVFVIVLSLFLFYGCNAASTKTSDTKNLDGLPITALPFNDSVFSIHPLDLNVDGREDLVLIVHGASYAQSLTQTSDLNFKPGPMVETVGFHPGEMQADPSKKNRYVVAAEGANSIRVFEFKNDLSFNKISEHRLAAPRYLTAFEWPEWGTSFAITPYASSALFLLRGFDSETAVSKQEIEVVDNHSQSNHYGVGKVAIADLDGDGIVELYYTTYLSNSLWRVKYPGEKDKGNIEPELVWRSDSGRPKQVFIIDVDDDGAKEIILPMALTQRTIVLEPDRSGGVKQQSVWRYPFKPGPYQSDMAKDKDGTVYLASGANGYLVVQRVNDNGQAVESIHLETQKSWPSYVVLSDMNNDGWLDLIVGMKSAGMASILIHGPLWPAMQELSNAGYQIKQETNR